MEMPSKTVFGNYSVEPSTYRNLVATAKRVDKVDAREVKLNQRERELAASPGAEEQAANQRQDRVAQSEKAAGWAGKSSWNDS